ncbi:MAG: lipid II flippase MurJ [Terrimesophilobacter sp.]
MSEASTGSPREVRLGGASLLMASGTIVSRALGFIKVAVLAAAIGQTGSASADAFGLASQLPNSVYALIAGGVLSAVLIPQIVKASRGSDGGVAYVNKIMTLGIVIFVVVTLAAVLLAPALVSLYASSGNEGAGFSPRAFDLAVSFAYLCLPQIFFYGLYSLLGEVLNARNVFGPFTWAPIVNNVVAILGLFVFMTLYGQAQQNSTVEGWPAEKILLLAGTATIGIALQSLVLTFFWKRAGLRFRPDFRWKGVGLSATGKVAGWLFGMVLVTQIAGVIQTRVLSLATGDAASVATFNASWIVIMLPHSVIAVSITTAYFTRISGHAARSDLISVRKDVSTALRAIGLLLIFSAVALAVVVYPFARVFETDFHRVISMGNVILAFLGGLVPFGAWYIVQRTFYALGHTRTTFFLQCLQAVIFISIALVCTTLPAQWIAVGVASGTTIAGITHATVGVILMRKQLGGKGGRGVARRYVNYFVLSVISGMGGVGVLVLLGGFSATGFAQSGRFEAIVSMGLVGIVMVVIYAGLLTLTRNPEFFAMTQPLKRLLRSRAE